MPSVANGPANPGELAVSVATSDARAKRTPRRPRVAGLGEVELVVAAEGADDRTVPAPLA